DIIGDLSEDDLAALGLPLGDRKRLIRAATTLRSTVPVEASFPALKHSNAPERRFLTILFCDLVGSTNLANRLDPEEGGEVIGQYLRAVSGAVSRFGGHTERLLGDGVLA